MKVSVDEIDFGWKCILPIVDTFPSTLVQRTSHHTRTFLSAHARTPDVIKRLAQRLGDLFVCLESHSIIWSCLCWVFLLHRFILFSQHLLRHWHRLLLLLRNWLESDQTLCNSALGWTVWPSGRSDPKTQVMSTSSASMSAASTADQPSDQKHEFPARERRDDHRFRGPYFTSTFGSIKAAAVRQQAEFPLCGNLVHLGTGLTKLLTDCDNVARRTSIKGDLYGHGSWNSCFKSFGVCVTGDERSRPKRSVNIQRQATSPQNPWTESWIGRASKDKSWGWRGSQTLEKEKLGYCSLWDQSGVRFPTITAAQANQWADPAQREKISLYGELEMRKTLPTKSSKKKINKLKNWEKFVAKKQTERDKQELTNYLCIKRGILPLWVSSWLNFKIYRTK